MLDGEYDTLCGLLPFAGRVDAGGGAYGPDDSVSSDCGRFGILDDEIESVEGLARTELMEAGSAGVAPDGAFRKIEFMGNGMGFHPVDEIVVNGVSFGVVANGAFAGMTGGFGFVRAWDGEAGVFGQWVLEGSGTTTRLAGRDFAGFCLDFWGMGEGACDRAWLWGRERRRGRHGSGASRGRVENRMREDGQRARVRAF